MVFECNENYIPYGYIRVTLRNADLGQNYRSLGYEMSHLRVRCSFPFTGPCENNYLKWSSIFDGLD